MTSNERQAKRGPDGRFLPGHKPPRSPGRPRGSKGVQARASKLAGEHLEQMLGRATEIISEELEDGNPAIAQWLIDRVRPPGRSDYLQLSEKLKLDTVEDIVAASVHIAETASQGEISLQQAKSAQEILGQHAQLKGLEELALLRSEVEELQRSRDAATTVSRPDLPVWGRLRETVQQRGQIDCKSSDQ